MAKKKRKSGPNEKCYQCDQNGTTREHVPPRSFFLDFKRDNLVTVPACPAHNNYNAKDVEYVRNVIVSADGINDVGLQLHEKAFRSFQKSPGLTKSTFRDVKRVIYNGEETISYQVDLPRMKRVMCSIAHALFYKEYGYTFPHHWKIYPYTLRSKKYEIAGVPDPQNTILRGLLDRIPLVYRDTNYPDVFQYAALKESDELMSFKFIFYGGVYIYAVGSSRLPNDE